MRRKQTNPTMKLYTLTTILLAAITPCSAKPPAPEKPATTEKAPEKTVLKQWECENATLGLVIADLGARQDNENGKPLNVALELDLESMKVPTLRLRNLTPHQIVQLVAELLDLDYLTAVGDDEIGVPVAWVLKRKSSQTAASGVVTLAASEKAPPQTRIIGIGLLIPKGTNDEAASAQKVVLQSIEDFVKEQDPDAEVKFYLQLGLVRITSTALPLIEQGIEEMKNNLGRKEAAAAGAATKPVR